MSRQARTVSTTSVYHAILRGVNKQQVFEDVDDYIHFRSILRRQVKQEKDEFGNIRPAHCHIYAYCLMGNHVHLLLKEGDESIGDTMKRLVPSHVLLAYHIP